MKINSRQFLKTLSYLAWITFIVISILISDNEIRSTGALIIANIYLATAFILTGSDK